MEHSIQLRLAHTEEDFLSAILLTDDSLSSFQRAWTTLENDISACTLHGDLSAATLDIAHTVASRISILSESFWKLHEDQISLRTHLLDGVQEILDGVKQVSLSSHEAISTFNDKACGDPLLLPPFIASAYHWLVDNIHNPYPSSETKRGIAEASRCSISSVNAWFINARRRIGWTTICRDYFNGCRADTIDAAYRALVKENPGRRLSPELIHAFMIMKVNAEGLYSSTFTKSALAGDLDAVVKDMTEEDKQLLEDEKYRQSEEVKLSKERQKETRRKRRSVEREMRNTSVAQDSYPSPDRSRTSSPVPVIHSSLTDESEDDRDILPPVVAGRKRRSSSVGTVDRLSPITASRPTKRLRSNASQVSCLSPEACLPSPPSSVDHAEDSSDNDSPTLTAHPPFASASQNDTDVTAPRKRRLSDADASGIPKRPRGWTAGPRLHAVSDPLPRSNVESEYSIEEWYNTNFDALFALPPPVDNAEPDFSAPWEVELFRDYSIPQDLQKCPSRYTSPFSLATQDSQASVSTDLAELESLLRSIESSALAAPSVTVDPIFTTSLSHSASHDVSSDLSQSIDWTTLLNDTDTEIFEPTIDSIFPQQSHTASHPLPEIDLSILQLPQIMPTVTSQTTLSADLASKQAKLNQLQAMQEAVRRMQNELQSEGVAFR